MKGKKTKKGIAIFEDKKIADYAYATEKHIDKLIKQKSASHDQMIVTSKLTVRRRKLKAMIRIKQQLKTKTPKHQSRCSSPIQVL